MRTIILIIAALALLSTSALAQTTVWDFDDGTFQNWGVAYRNGPQAGLDATIEANANYDNSLSMNLHANRDTNWGTYAYYYLPQLGYANGVNSFRFSAQITYNDLRAMWNGGLAYSANAASPGATAWFEGYGKDNTQDRDKIVFKETYTQNTFTEKWNNAFRIGAASDGDGGSFNNGPATVFMEIDYNASVAGKVILKFKALDYSSVLADGQNVLWEDEYDNPLAIDANTGDYHAVHWLRLGGEYGHFDLNYDNVTFQAVPEPGTMAALGTGLVGLVGFGLRRRK